MLLFFGYLDVLLIMEDPVYLQRTSIDRNNRSDFRCRCQNSYSAVTIRSISGFDSLASAQEYKLNLFKDKGLPWLAYVSERSKICSEFADC